MNQKLQDMLRRMRQYRLVEYSNTAYLNLGNSIDFSDAPVELEKLWYDPDSISFVSQSLRYDSDIGRMSNMELIRQIHHEWILSRKLRKIFAQLKK